MSEVQNAVYYAKEDQIGLFRRLWIDLVDGVVLLVMWICSYWMIRWTNGKTDASIQTFYAMIFGTTFVYMVVLKRVAHTLGYVLGGAQVVNLYGQRPSIGSLAMRSLFIFIGPGNTLLDLVWLTGDSHRQAIRDKMSRSYVIRKGSQPAGQGHIRYVRLSIAGYQLLLPEVARDADAVLEKR